MQTYQSDLSDSQWEVVEKLLDCQRKRKYDLRQILNGILYLLDNGVKWRNLPKEYPRWQSVYYYFRKWSKEVTLQKVQQSLLTELRVKQKREVQPSLGIIDSQTVRTSKLADQQTVGINGHRWIKGRKRHLLVEVNGHLLSVQIQPANLPDEIGAWPVIRPVKGLKKILADQGYDNDLLKDLCLAVNQTQLEIVRKQTEQKGFVVQPKRWVVERSHAWHGEKRRLKVDYERKIHTAEAFLWLSDSMLLLNKLYPK